jgi:hypothetical protein
MKRKYGRTAFLFATLPLWLAAAPSWASAILYSNLGPGDTFIVNREYDTGSDFLASPFVATSSGILASIQTPVFSLDSPVNFGLYASTSADSVGDLLESWSAPVPGFPSVLATLNSSVHPELTAGIEYWFVIGRTSRFQVAWYENNQEITGGVWEGLGPTGLDNLLQFVPGSPAPAIQLNATPVPSAALSLGSGLVLLTLARAARRRRFP